MLFLEQAIFPSVCKVIYDRYIPKTNRQPRGAAYCRIYLNLVLLLHDVHLLNEALAITELLDYEEHVADVDIDTTLKVVIEIDVAAE